MLECQTMGHIFSNLATNRPPPNLKTLLQEIDSSPEGIDRSPWASAFKDYLLRQRDGTEIMTKLEFIIIAQQIQIETGKIRVKSIASSNWELEQSRELRRALLLQTRDLFFSENCLNPIGLSNGVLRDDLCSKLDEEEPEMEELCDLVEMARADPSVWKSGVEFRYNTFLASKPTLSRAAINAVLMAIM